MLTFLRQIIFVFPTHIDNTMMGLLTMLDNAEEIQEERTESDSMVGFLARRRS